MHPVITRDMKHDTIRSILCTGRRCTNCICSGNCTSHRKDIFKEIGYLVDGYEQIDCSVVSYDIKINHNEAHIVIDKDKNFWYNNNDKRDIYEPFSVDMLDSKNKELFDRSLDAWEKRALRYSEKEYDESFCFRCFVITNPLKKFRMFVERVKEI